LLMLALRFPQSIVIEANGAWSWLAFPGIGTIQPAEFMKIFLVLALAHIMYRHHAKFIQKTTKSDLWLLAKMMFASLPPMGLIMVQPDLGSALILASITACMILVSGIRWRIILTVILSGVGIVILLVAICIFSPALLQRFLKNLCSITYRAGFMGGFILSNTPNPVINLFMQCLPSVQVSYSARE